MTGLRSRASLVLLAVLAAAAAAGCGGGERHPIAYVDGEAITREKLDTALERLREDRRQKGEVEEFPAEGSPGYERLRDSILDVLVLRVELEHAARRLGIRVSDDEVDRLLEAGGGAPGEGTSAARELARDSLRAQLLYQRISERVTRGIRAGSADEQAAKRRAALNSFVRRMRRRAHVRYEPGYAPGS